MLKGRRTLLLVVLFLLTLITQTLSAAPFEKAQEIYLKPGFDLVGEKLEYATSLRGLPVGRQVVEFESRTPYMGREVYVVSFKGYPNLVLKAVNYSNNEVFYLDTETFLPLYTSRTYSAGFSSGFMESFFLADSSEIKVQVTESEPRSFTAKVEDPFHGETTLVLFARFADVSKYPVIDVFSGVGTQYLQLLPGKDEKVTVPAGTFDTEVVLISPEIGKVWVSKDRYRIPVKIVLDTNAGLLEMNLISETR